MKKRSSRVTGQDRITSGLAPRKGYEFLRRPPFQHGKLPGASTTSPAASSCTRPTCSINCPLSMLQKVKPDEVYNLAAMSFVPFS